VPAILFLFSLANLVIGTGAYVLTGILQPMAASLQVSVAAAGQAMTAHALATALLAPLILLATGRWPRKRAMLLALALFAGGGALCAWATTLTVLLVGRVLMGAGTVFTAIVAGVAVAIVAPQQRGRALAVTFLGMSLSYALGVPLGAWLGLTYGWQVPVWLVAAACVAVAALLAIMLPERIEAPGSSFRGLGAAARQGHVLRVWGRTLLYIAAIFTVFAYVGPVLLALNPLSPAQLSVTLVLFGCSGVIGSVLGGLSADRFGAVPTLRVQLLVLASLMVLVPFTQGHPVLTVLVFMLWGLAGFGMLSPQQVMLATHAPTQAAMLMSLNGSMLYLGSALGAIVSGSLVEILGFARLSWVGLPLALLALATLWFDRQRPIVAAAGQR
jgi:MFS transporter, DHA1 family, inner membrane transport protein